MSLKLTPEDQTIKLLHAISKRLASRGDCNHHEYLLELNISDNNELTYQFSPGLIWVCPTRYHRKKTDMLPIVDFILTTQFDSVLSIHNNHMYLKDLIFTPGLYRYKMSISGRQRKWFREV